MCSQNRIFLADCYLNQSPNRANPHFPDDPHIQTLLAGVPGIPLNLYGRVREKTQSIDIKVLLTAKMVILHAVVKFLRFGLNK